MRKKLFTLTTIVTLSITSFFMGAATTTTTAKQTINTDSKEFINNYIDLNTFETYYTDNNELHIIANNGNEYVFEK